MENPPSDSFSTQLVGHLSLAEHFGVELPSEDDSKKLQVLWDYGEKLSPDNPKGALQAIESRLGKGQDTQLDRVYRWVRLREAAY